MAKKPLGLEEIAAEVGRLFGTTERHARKWLDERQTLLEALGTVRDRASSLMAELGIDGARLMAGQKRRRTSRDVKAAPLTDTPRKRRGRRKISEATKAKMRAAAVARWARVKKAGGAAAKRNT